MARPGGRLYVFHKHAASHLHFDLRLEMEGVLRSWAVPKGPSYDPAEKRLAVLVEDHPVEYGDFEGLIPEGNYGAGAVILWDRGSWVPLNDPAEGLAQGKLLFELRGYKLRGVWTLVKIKKAQREWLLIKERDGHAVAGGREVPEGSVQSGRLVEDLKAGRDPAEPLRAELASLAAPRTPPALSDTKPMLAETRDRPFTKPGWVFELKLDGHRILAGRASGAGRLRTRNGLDATATFPEVARAVGALPFEGLILDGEVIALDDKGHPDFSRLQRRAKLTRAADVRRAVLDNPVVYFAFDLLAVEGFDLRGLPLLERKRLLRLVLPSAGPLVYVDHFAERGEELYAQVERMGLEGVVAKKADAPYRMARSPAWLKIRADRVDDFVVVGFTAPKGGRGGFGALELAQYRGDELQYVGRVGSGFDDALLTDLGASLADEARSEPPCALPDGIGRGSTWVRPERVAEVRFKERTADGLLRHPVFLRLRDDKPAAECILREPAPDTPPPLVEDPPPAPAVVLSNLDKVFWAEEGYTKGDLIDYYRAVAPRLLPYLRHRPVVLTRYPDGIAGKSFYQKDAPRFVPDWLRTVRVWSEHAQREIDYFVCDDEPSLLYLANMASIPLHVWASRVDRLERPDWCILDLDPKGAPFADVVTVARALHALCQRIGLPHYVKTSGSTGLHVMVPLGGQLTFEQSRTLGELVSRVIVAELPQIATITRAVSRRGGKVYLDYLQNRHGQLIVAPFSVRPLPGAPVSMPLRWAEVTGRLRLDRYTIKTVPQRLTPRWRDPFLPVLTEVPELPPVLEALRGELAAASGGRGRRARPSR